MLAIYGGFWESWDSGHKVQFDPFTKIIHINDGITLLDVKADIYSAWKQWMLFLENNNMWQLPAMRAVGGDPISDTSALGSTFFLTNGWRIKPWNNHTNITIEGNLFVEEGGRPIIPDDNGNDSVSFYVSNLVDAIIIDNSDAIDIDAPLWDGPIGIIDCYQDGKFITARWSAANDVNEIRYKLYISLTNTAVIDPVNFYGSFTGNMANISTEADGVTPLSDADYYVAVTAIDKVGNETTNTNYAIVNYSLADAAPITAQSIWEYTTQTAAFANLGLTDEQTAKLNEILTEVATEGKKTRNTVLAN